MYLHLPRVTLSSALLYIDFWDLTFWNVMLIFEIDLSSLQIANINIFVFLGYMFSPNVFLNYNINLDKMVTLSYKLGKVLS